MQEVPVGVVQWDGLIAVSYAARKFGVKRGDRSATARTKCPHILLPHVEYISNTAAPAESEPDRASGKVSLRRYREASKEVIEVTQSNSEIDTQMWAAATC